MKDYLIVGQGIAGSLLTYELLKRKKKVMIVDDHNRQSSSTVAAGIISPMHGKRMTLVDHYNQLYVRASLLYHELEEKFGETYFERLPILRIFQNKEEHDAWMKTLESHPDQSLVEPVRKPESYAPYLLDPWGSVLMYRTGFCHSEKMLNRLRKFFKDEGILKASQFLYDDLILEADSAVYDGEKYKKVIFCEGYQMKDNPWFKWIPFQPVKGEIIKIRLEDTGFPQLIINKGKWLVPLGNGEWLAGSNYVWDRLDCEPTIEGKKEITKGLSSIFEQAVRVIDHKAGIRPATTDQKPIVGLHPKHSVLGVFNGFSSKGFLLAPALAEQFAEFLSGGAFVDQSLDVQRFWKN